MSYEPALEVRARSLALLRVAEDQELRRHRNDHRYGASLVLGLDPLCDVRLPLPGGFRHVSTSQAADGEWQEHGKWQTEWNLSGVYA